MTVAGGVPGLEEDSRELRRGLARLGRRYDARGWLFGTCGNLSGRVGDRVTITASGRHKGELDEDDFVTVALDGALVAAGAPGARASAETSIHLALYRALPSARVVVHVHTVASSLVRGVEPSDAAARASGVVGELGFPGLEMVKGWGLWAEDARPVLPIFANHADVPAIARDVESFYATPREVPALVIAGHGLTAWGGSLFEANRHLEVAEFLCQVAHAR